jgi:hypothetical protein
MNNLLPFLFQTSKSNQLNSLAEGRRQKAESIKKQSITTATKDMMLLNYN